MAWRRAWRERTMLHIWLAVALTAFLADIAASLGASGRYTLSWYLGRVESMVAGSVLLLVLLRDLNALYQRLAGLMRDLASANARLLALVEQKDALVSDLRRSEEQVRQLAYYDTLTSLPNRRLLFDRLGQAAAQARRHGNLMAILFIDLDSFKEINDELGHDAGDVLLRQVATRLKGCVRETDTVARSGGDEFIVVLAELAHPDDAARVADKAIKAIAAPVAIGEQSLHVTASIGIALYPTDGSDEKELLKQADKAMYVAKGSGRNTYRFYGALAARRAVQ
jgi:diguanylate cyclase (GGDEF)-like protein